MTFKHSSISTTAPVESDLLIGVLHVVNHCDERIISMNECFLQSFSSVRAFDANVAGWMGTLALKNRMA